MIGSGIGGAIALGLGSRITAPHGGIVIVGTDGAHLLSNSYCTSSWHISFSINLRFNKTED